MKELTIEEKAKAYDEAIKKAKGVIEQNPLMEYLKKGIEYILPELKESEDEIIKELMSFIRGMLACHDKPNAERDEKYESWIAWLEKQGDKPQGKSVLEAIKEEKVDNANKIEQKDYNSIDPHFGKPIDKVEPKFNVGDKVYNIKNRFESTIESIDDTTYYCDTTNFDIKDQNNWELVEQKPIEWSEEDERMYRGIHNLIYSTPYCNSRKELSDWLKSIKDRVQPQLQQEWGEEDEKCIRLSTDIIDSALRAGFCVQLDRDRCVDWLKSLRLQRQWKPSEEYILVIESCMKEFDEGSIKWNLLKELLEQLKQL